MSSAIASAGTRPTAVSARAAYSIAAIGVFLLLAFDGRMHPDEASYLYIGAYLSAQDIVAGHFQPSGIEGQYLSRMFHVLFIHAVTRLTGPGVGAFAIIVASYFALLLAATALTVAVLRELMPGVARLERAAPLMMFTPVYLYMAFNTLPEIPAFFFSTLASFALLRSQRRRATAWIAVACVSLTAVAFFKNNIALLWISLVAALLIAPPMTLSRARLFVHAFVAGTGALVLSLVLLSWWGIGLETYLGVGAALRERSDPLVVNVLNVGIEGGLLLLALPFAFMTRRRKELRFFLLWFLLASIPLYAVFPYVEHRYLVVNLIAFTALLWLAAEAVAPHVIAWWQRRRLATAFAGTLAAAALVGSNALALAVAMHELRIGDMGAIVERVKREYGDNAAILVSWPFSDFSYLRFMYPNLRVYSVQTIFPDQKPERAELERRNEDRYYKQLIRSATELRSVESPFVYLAFKETFGVANLRTIVSYIPIPWLERNFDKVDFLDHRALSWMWHDPAVTLTEKFRRGHYSVYDVELHDELGR